MISDFARSAFNAAKRFFGVLMQQGRVALDTDAAEPSAGNQPPVPAHPEPPGTDSKIKIRKPG
jgi:hypothetical protein